VDRGGERVGLFIFRRSSCIGGIKNAKSPGWNKNISAQDSRRRSSAYPFLSRFIALES